MCIYNIATTRILLRKKITGTVELRCNSPCFDKSDIKFVMYCDNGFFGVLFIYENRDFDFRLPAPGL